MKNNKMKERKKVAGDFSIFICAAEKRVTNDRACGMVQMMDKYDDEVISYFLEHQNQLFPENVADTPEEAEAFLEDCMAVVCSSLQEVKEYFDEAGTDIAGMDDEELLSAEELFALPGGRFLIVEGQFSG